MHRWITGGLIALFVAYMNAAALTQTPDSPSTGKTTAQKDAAHKAAPQEEEFAQQVVELTNRERARYKLGPLTLQKNLSTAAHWMYYAAPNTKFKRFWVQDFGSRF